MGRRALSLSPESDDDDLAAQLAALEQKLAMDLGYDEPTTAGAAAEPERAADVEEKPPRKKKKKDKKKVKAQAGEAAGGEAAAETVAGASLMEVEAVTEKAPEAVAFRLFSNRKGPAMVTLAPIEEVLEVKDPRIRDEDDEDPVVLAARKRDIALLAIDGNQIRLQAPLEPIHPRAASKVTTRRLGPGLRLASLPRLAYLNAIPPPPSTPNVPSSKAATSRKSSDSAPPSSSRRKRSKLAPRQPLELLTPKARLDVVTILNSEKFKASGAGGASKGRRSVGEKKLVRLSKSRRVAARKRLVAK